MKIGIIAEGHRDRAVIENVLVGLTTLDSSDVIPLRPSYLKDETDKAKEKMDDSKEKTVIIKDHTTSSYSIIKKECEEKELIEGFLAIHGQEFIVLHIDTAEADKYGVQRPKRENNANYCQELRAAVVHEINKWLQTEMSKHILYAVAIEETDAWVLGLFEAGSTTQYIDAKGRLQRTLNKKGVAYNQDPFTHYSEISKPFKKKKIISDATLRRSNCSLKSFCEEIESKVLPKLVEQQGE